MILEKRQAGVLLHPTSLPGPYGIGDLGPEAIKFIDWMQDAGFGLWQVLPLNPTGYGDSPYQSFSAFAGNPYLVSPDLLIEDGLLTPQQVRHPRFPANHVEYGSVIEWKTRLLRIAFETFRSKKHAKISKRLNKFRERKNVKSWLDDFALFISLKGAHGGAVWNTWDKPLRHFKSHALKEARRRLADEIEFHIFAQFLFFDQWERVRAEAHKRKIGIIGDMPIYVAYDSADTWAHQHLFKLKKDGSPTHVAGVPPDYFSETGQLWGNPIYRYDKMKDHGFKWWISRFRSTMEQVDYIRLDHFRGFEAFWQVRHGENTAINGNWVKGPRDSLFEALEKALGRIPIIAENLGVITPSVEELRHRFNLPGMKVLQFGWGVAGSRPFVPDPDCVFHPHKIEHESVVYTGTHDNPTTRQWWDEFAGKNEKAFLKEYLNTNAEKPEEDLLRAMFQSPANTAIAPMQDFLGLGSEGRMNYPGRDSGNWTWRMKKGAASKTLSRKLRNELLLYDRHVGQKDIAANLVAKQSEEQRSRKA